MIKISGPFLENLSESIDNKKLVEAWDEWISVVKDIYLNNSIIIGNKDFEGVKKLEKISLYIFSKKWKFYDIKCRFIGSKRYSPKKLISSKMLIDIYEKFKQKREGIRIKDWNHFRLAFIKLISKRFPLGFPSGGNSIKKSVIAARNNDPILENNSLSEEFKDSLLIAFDNLINYLHSVFRKNIYPNLESKLSYKGIENLSMLLFGSKYTLYQWKQFYINWRNVKYFRRLIKKSQLDRLFTLVEVYYPQIEEQWSKIYRHFIHIYQLRFPGQTLIPTLVSDPRSKEEILNEIRIHFNQFVLEEFRNYYPKDLDKFTGIAQLGRIFLLNDDAIASNWVIRLIKEQYSRIGISKPEEARILYESIWTKRCNRNRTISYNKIKDFVKVCGGWLITTNEEFDVMKELPTRRMITIAHKSKQGKVHKWKVPVKQLLYYQNWCPYCRIGKSQNAMKLFMEMVLSKHFGIDVVFKSEVSLMAIFKIPWKEGGRLRFDGCSNPIHVKGKKLIFVFEYDGIQHDKWPNPFHKTKNQFLTLRKNDAFEDALIKKFNKENVNTKVILVRLKEINEYKWSTANEKYENGIINAIKKTTGTIKGMEIINITHKNIKIDKKSIIKADFHQKKIINYD